MPETTTKTERQELSTRARRCLDTQTAKLLSAASDEGWEGRLSSSALASAVAAGALLSHVRATGSDTCQPAQAAAHRALGWIADHQNADGGWGDSPESPSNLATTLLAFASFCIADANTETTDKAKGWLKAHCGSTDPADWRKAVLDFYAEDRTF